MMINQYLQKIPVDRFTRLTAAWSVTTASQISPRAQLYAGLGGTLPGFQATVLLPHKTPLHRPVRGGLRNSKRAAKAAAALEVVRLLHACGELDDNLGVIRRVVKKTKESGVEAERAGEQNIT